MLSVKFFGLLWRELKQLKICDGKLFFSLRDDFSDIHICVRLDHAIRPEILKQKLLISLCMFSNKCLSSKLVPKVDNLELSIVADKDIADEQILKLYIVIDNFLEEDLLVFNIVLN